MNPKVILFDLDDTLADRTAALRRYAAKLHADFLDNLHPCTPREVHASLVAADDFGSAKQARELIASSLWRIAPDPLSLIDHWNKRFGEAATPFAGALDLLDHLNGLGVKLGLVTNGVAAMQRSKISALKIERFLDVVIVSSEVGLKKPDGAIFDLALRRLGFPPGAAWFVGDHPNLDVRASAAAGLRAFWVKTGRYAAVENVPGIHIETIADIRNHLN